MTPFAAIQLTQNPKRTNQSNCKQCLTHVSVFVTLNDETRKKNTKCAPNCRGLFLKILCSRKSHRTRSSAEKERDSEKEKGKKKQK